MSDIWIVIVEDRHSDVDALPFSSEELAGAEARKRAGQYGGTGGEDAELNRSMIADGWVLYLPYGSEGDSVRVVRRSLDSPVSDSAEDGVQRDA